VAIVGYARVSSNEQKLEVQLDKLKKQNCDRIYQEKESGRNLKQSQLKLCLDYVREDDILVITKLDRLARSTLDLCNIAKLLEDKKVALKVIDQNLDTSTPTGRLLFHMLSSIAQFETEIRAERQLDGIQKAKENGVKFGRVKALNEQQILELKEKRLEGITISGLMIEYGLSKKSIYNYLNYENEK
jgi:DNA invertase Pin-like site-specific DNA recombinase